MPVLYLCLLVGCVACAVLAVWANRLLAASLWLAALSALLALLFYLMGAPRIAVIELSVGAGLVTVLLVFAIGIAGDEAANLKPLVPRPVSLGLGLLVLVLLGWFVLSLAPAPAPVSEPSLASLLWEGRALDVWIQVVLIFTGVLGVLGLLGGTLADEVLKRGPARGTPEVGTEPTPKANDKEVQP
jgi:uncharacterized MnhB-related membrane protein